jgi:hypothetical protein
LRSTFWQNKPDCPDPIRLDRMSHPHPPHPHHHHDPDHAHPSAEVAPSLLRLSAPERLAGAAVLIVLLWGAVYWATR